MIPSRRGSRRSTAALCLGMAVLFGVVAGPGGSARACRTPIFRYAMYNWPSAPYWVFSIHHGQRAEEDQAVDRAIQRAAADRAAPLNLMLEVTDADAPEQFGKLPDRVQAAYRTWREQAETEPPPGAVHLVFTAWGAQLWTGRLTEETVAALVRSPSRREIGRLFDQGNAAVLVLLAGANDRANREAEVVVDSLLAEAARGKFVAEIPLDPYEHLMPARGSVPGPDGATPDASPGANRAPAPEAAPAGVALGAKATVRETLRLAKVVVRRDDATERWLVDSLLALEPDLAEWVDEPMVFVVYGRGRAMPPCVGKGITLEYLAEAVGFLAGACSCQVKDENPGMDLLMAWNWDATAQTWAAGDPELLAASDQPGAQTNQPRTQDRGSAPPSGAGGSENPSTGAGDSQHPPTRAGGSEAQWTSTGAGGSEAQSTGSGRVEDPSIDPSGSRRARPHAGLRTIGLGIVLAAVLILGAGFVLMRRRGDVP